MTEQGRKPQIRPGFFRRLAALIYDSLLLLAVLFLATALALPLNAGQAFRPDQLFFPFYLLAISFVYYGWFWTHGGQTLGLRSWKIKLQTFDHRDLSWLHAGRRFFGGLAAWLCFGLGFIWLVFDKNRYTWYDYWSGSSVFFDDSNNR